METRGGFYITQIKQLQDRIFEKLLAEQNLSISSGQGRILFVLWKQDRQTVGDISRQTSLAKNTVSLILDGMAAHGIVERTVNPDNRRQTLISLTPYALSMRKRYETVSQQMNTLFYSGFSDVEKDHFEADLIRILETLQQFEIKMEKEKRGKTHDDH